MEFRISLLIAKTFVRDIQNQTYGSETRRYLLTLQELQFPHSFKAAVTDWRYYPSNFTSRISILSKGKQKYFKVFLTTLGRKIIALEI